MGRPAYVADKYPRIGPWVLRDGALYHDSQASGWCEVPLDRCRYADQRACYEEMARVADKTWATQDDINWLAVAFNDVVFYGKPVIRPLTIVELRARDFPTTASDSPKLP